MRETLIVAKREIRAIISNKRALFSALIFVVVWGFISVPRLTSRLGAGGGFGNTIFYLATLLCLYVGFVFSAQSFLTEKRDSRIGTLLCTPLTVRKLWFGKVIGVVLPSFGIGLIVTVIVGIVGNIRTPTFVNLGAPLFVYIFIVLPLLLTAFIGLLGYFQLILGMKENRIIYIVIMVLLFGGLGAANSLTGGMGFIRWPVIGVVFAGVVLLLLVLLYITRFIKVERIITSIE